MSSDSQVSTLTAISNKPGTSKRAEELASVVDMLEDYGRVLILDREGYARTLGFEALAGLLNINLVDRERARRAGWPCLVDLAAIEGMDFIRACPPSCSSRERLAASARIPPWLFTMRVVRTWWSGSRTRYTSWYPRNRLLVDARLVALVDGWRWYNMSRAQVRKLLVRSPVRTEKGMSWLHQERNSRCWQQ